MTFTPKTWHDGPTGATPISAAELNRMEAGIVEAAAGGGGGSVLADLPPIGTRWGVPGTLLGGGADQSVFANAVYYNLISTDVSITVTAAKCSISTGPPSDGNIRMGIYAADPGMQPDGAPLWDSGSVAVETDFIGSKTVTDVSVELEPGYYLAAFSSSVALALTSSPHSGARFVTDDQPVGFMYNLMDFGPFPTPGIDSAAEDTFPPRAFFVMQWTNA